MLKEPITIDNWQKGIAISPYFGFEEMRGVDIYSKPGVLQAGFRSVKQSGTTFGVSDYPLKILKNGDDLYAITSAKIWKYTASGATWGELTGYKGGVTFQDALFWKGYLLVFRSNYIDVYDIAGSQGWTNNWKTDAVAITVATGIVPFVGSDDKVYMGIGSNVEILSVVAGATLDFDNTATFSIQSPNGGAAGYLDLPVGNNVQLLEEINGYLMVTATNTNTRRTDIYRWDKTSSTFNNTISLGTNLAHANIAVENLLYIIAGNIGSIYVTDGINVKKVAELPESITKLRLIGFPLSMYRNAIAYFNDKIYFGLSTVKSTSYFTPSLIWSFDPASKAINEEHIISSGGIGAVSTSYALEIRCLLSGVFASGVSSLYYSFSDRNNTSYGVDYISNSARTTGYTSFVVSQFYSVGSKRQPHTFKSFEAQLAKPLVTGEGLKFYYRTAQNGSWTQIGSTWSYGASAGTNNQSFVADFVPTAENIQFKIEITTAGTASESPELLYCKAI